MEPYVFLLDLDGTMQGNIGPQVREYELVSSFRTMEDTRNIHYNEDQLYVDMGRGLIRPQLAKTLIDIKNKHPNVEFFVYTASSDLWANFLLPKIFRYLFKNRQIINPLILSRKDCLPTGMKSIHKVKPQIKRFLQRQKKYSHSQFNHVFLVDNSYVLHQHEAHLLIHCPTYDYKVMSCPLRNIPPSMLHKHYNTLSNRILGMSSSGKIDFIRKYYDSAFKEFVQTDEINAKHINDNYWPCFRRVFMRYKTINEDNINHLVQQLKRVENMCGPKP